MILIFNNRYSCSEENFLSLYNQVDEWKQKAMLDADIVLLKKDDRFVCVMDRDVTKESVLADLIGFFSNAEARRASATQPETES